MATLPTYLAHLKSTYARQTAKTYIGDIRELSVFLRERKLGEITLLDLQERRATLVTGAGECLQEKTIARKVSAVSNYFGWLSSTGVILTDPSLSLWNSRVQSPLPDYLYDSEVERLYQVASDDPRTYLLVLLFLETGLKSSELFSLTVANVDTSDPYRPELWIKHTGKATKKDRKVALPARFVGVYEAYREQYQANDMLFDFTDRFGRLLFIELKTRSGIQNLARCIGLAHGRHGGPAMALGGTGVGCFAGRGTPPRSAARWVVHAPLRLAWSTRSAEHDERVTEGRNMSPDWDYQCQRLFALSGVVGIVFMFLAWEVFWPQPPDFSMSGPQTAQFYATHQMGFLIGVTLTAIGLPFLMAWDLQLSAMLRRLEGGQGLVTIVATVGITAIPLLLSFDCAVWGVAAYRPLSTNPDVTRALSDVAWISSMLIWPPLAMGMILVGVLILKTRHLPGGFPTWLGWYSIFVGCVEPGQAGIIFDKTGVFAPNGPGSWYAAILTWGTWIVFMGIAQARILAREKAATDQSAVLTAST